MAQGARVGRFGVVATGVMLAAGGVLSCGPAFSSAPLSAGDLTKRVGSADFILIEFGDFQCPFCARQATQVQAVIQRRFVETGELSYAYVHFPREDLHGEAFRASEAAECAGKQGRYWEMHRRLFEDWERLTAGSFLQHARELRLELDVFERCMGGEAAEGVRADRRLGWALGVRAVPTFFVGRVHGDGSVVLMAPFFGTAPPEVVSRMIGEQRAVERGRWRWWLGGEG